MKPRVAFLTSSLQYGGAERWIITLCRHFQNIAPACIFLTGDYFDADLMASADRHCPVIIPPAYTAEAIHATIGLHAKDFDILISWGDTRLAKYHAGINRPFVVCCHASGEWKEHREIFQRSISGADYYTAVSQTAAKSFGERTATVIYNGIELDRVSPRIGRDEQRKRWGIDDDERVGLFLSRAAAEKGLRTILNAVPDFAELKRKWWIVFVDTGPDMAAVRAMQEDYPDTVLIVPTNPHVGDYLAAADMLLMPSITEGNPLLMLEALAGGLPVAVTPIPAVMEILPMLPTNKIQLLDKFSISKFAARVDFWAGNKLIQNRVPDPDIFQKFSASAMAERWELFINAAIADYRKPREVREVTENVYVLSQ